MNKTLVFALIGLLSFAACANYSVLIAGSNGYENYRHQADVCHAYQTLIKKGFEPENIVVLMYNDVADNKKNPFKGKLFNKPNGEDVYAGCVIDYQGADVTPKNYISVLTGDKNAVANIGTGRVLESTQDDNVFLYFTDHGAPGLIAFPSTVMYANELLATFQKMHDLQKYNKLVYYLETCESGSMFVNLPTNLNIYAVSAANPSQSSYAAYCGLQAHVKGKLIGSCLGDLFSVNFLEELDATSNLDNLTLQQQFKDVAKKTNMSQVMQWGDLTFTSEPLSDFVTAQTPSTKSLTSTLMNFFKFASPSMRKVEDLVEEEEEQGIHKHDSFVDSRKAKLNYLLHSYTITPSSESFEELNIELHNDQKFQSYFDEIATKIGVQNSDIFSSTNFICYKNMVDAFVAKCGQIPDSQLGGLRHFYSYCQRTFIQEASAADLLENIC